MYCTKRGLVITTTIHYSMTPATTPYMLVVFIILFTCQVQVVKCDNTAADPNIYDSSKCNCPTYSSIFLKIVDKYIQHAFNITDNDLAPALLDLLEELNRDLFNNDGFGPKNSNFGPVDDNFGNMVFPRDVLGDLENNDNDNDNDNDNNNGLNIIGNGNFVIYYNLNKNQNENHNENHNEHRFREGP